MAITALITLDLPDVTDKQRTMFYNLLSASQWRKLEHLSTAWTKTFSPSVSRNVALSTLKYDISAASLQSSISRVSYALQVGEGGIEIG